MHRAARQITSAGIGILALAMTGAVATAQEAKAALPDVTACPESIAAIATCYTAKQGTGAYLLAAMPKNWNGNLIVFAHGGPDTAPPTATRSQADLAKYAVAVQRGFAWIATTYRREGYGIAMAVEDSDNARKFFIARIAKPQRTILHGTSYGGLVGAKLVETRAKNPDGSPNFDGAQPEITTTASICAWSTNITARTCRGRVSRNTRCGTASSQAPR